MVQMLPTYTLERLQDTDVDLLLPLYNWYCKQNSDSYGETLQGNVVYRDGKAYKKADPKKASWIYS